MQIDPRDFAAKMYTWMEEGFKELGDFAGMGVGNTTVSVLDHPEFFSDPHKVLSHWAHDDVMTSF